MGDGGLHATDAFHGHTVGQEVDRRAQEWIALVAAARWQDTGHHPVFAAGGWLGGAAKDPHRCYLHAACRATESHPLQGGGWVQRPGCNSPEHGGHEQAYRGGGREEDIGRNHIEERKACLESVRGPHASSHQPFWQVHYRWSLG